jgi:formate dehydrogenase subunit gamma
MSDPALVATTLVEPGDEIRPGDPPTVSRYRLETRINHWTTAVAMVLLVLSGLAMFHPALFFLSIVFGGGETMRALHPWLGLVLVGSFALLFRRFWRGNLWNRTDGTWALHLGDLVRGREDKMPEIGKYNAGQKFVFWAMALLILVMLTTGLVIWEAYFGRATPIPLQREAIFIHSMAAVFVILVLILHVYSGIWVRGSFDAMIKGFVTVGWAWRHHRLWYRRLAARLRGGDPAI